MSVIGTSKGTMIPLPVKVPCSVIGQGDSEYAFMIPVYVIVVSGLNFTFTRIESRGFMTVGMDLLNDMIVNPGGSVSESSRTGKNETFSTSTICDVVSLTSIVPNVVRGVMNNLGLADVP
jgi:hypothetical protein